MKEIKDSKSILISEVIINKCIDRKINLNTSKLIKLLYLMNLEHIKRHGTLLFDSDVTMTENGPMINDIYNYFKYGALGFDYKIEQSVFLTDNHEFIANEILDKYGDKTPQELINITKKSPMLLILKNHTN